ncbi:hypothetical protein E3N88_36057 [Mikania micrantha]|uniref:Uncharacterized protein n=1 Tax=Mikania micrantha TaxID=192012 RepID=A0A5N6M2T6_9ASTR|nr:hypothetical protein E3N88_36057 [Mikania micrantha]
MAPTSASASELSPATEVTPNWLQMLHELATGGGDGKGGGTAVMWWRVYGTVFRSVRGAPHCRRRVNEPGSKRGLIQTFSFFSRSPLRVFLCAVSIAQEASIEAVQFQPEWIEWKERVIEEVPVPEKENEYENPSSKLVLKAESKNDKVVGLCHNNDKLEEVRVVSSKCKPIKIQGDGVTQAKEGGKQVKDEDTRESFKANKEYARDKDKAMKIKEKEVYHKGRKPKFRDNGG